MRTKLSFIVLMLLFCLSVFGQQSINVPTTRKSSTSLIQSSANQQETIQQLQAENHDLQNRLKEMEENQVRMEKEIEIYRGDIRAKNSDINDLMSNWLTAIGIITGLIGVFLGVIIPMFINNDNSKRLESRFYEIKEDLQKQVDKAEQQATKAAEKASESTSQVAEATRQATSAAEKVGVAQNVLSEMNDLKKQVTEIQEKINKDASDAEKAAIEAKTSELFSQAINEKDPFRAIELYNQYIVRKPKSHKAYNNRGILKKDIGDTSGAMDDYDKAIKLNPNYEIAYINRGILKRDQDDLQEAIADFNKAIELKPDYAKTYQLRGCIKINNGDYYGAIEDFNMAISIKPDLTLSYENRAKCYRKLAESEQDEAKKAKIIANAEADEKRVESLKEKE